MWIWNKLTKAEIVRTNDELRIRTISTFIPLTINLLGLTFLYYFFATHDTWSQVLFVSIAICIFIISIIIDDCFDLEYTSILKNAVKVNGLDSDVLMKKPFFIDLLVKPNRLGIKVLISISGNQIGAYTLKNGNALAQLIDGLTDFLGVELMENIKLSKGELLNFQSKNTAVATPSDFAVRRVFEILSITSRHDSERPIRFNFEKAFVNTSLAKIPIGNISKLLIKPIENQLRLYALLFTNEKVRLFQHTSTELDVIRDAKKLLQLFSNQQELQGIDIELVEKF